MSEPKAYYTFKKALPDDPDIKLMVERFWEDWGSFCDVHCCGPEGDDSLWVDVSGGDLVTIDLPPDTPKERIMCAYVVHSRMFSTWVTVPIKDGTAYLTQEDFDKIS